MLLPLKLLVLSVGVRSQAYLFQQMNQAPAGGSLLMFLQLLIHVDFLKILSMLKTLMKILIQVALTLSQRM